MGNPKDGDKIYYGACGENHFGSNEGSCGCSYQEKYIEIKRKYLRLKEEIRNNH